MHLTRLAVEAQRQFLFSVDELQRLGLDLTLDADHTLGLLGAQA